MWLRQVVCGYVVLMLMMNVVEFVRGGQVEVFGGG